MDKRDLYEHLAKIYLDASLKRTGKQGSRPKFSKIVFSAGIIFILSLNLILLYALQKRSIFKSQVALVLLYDVAKINFNFDPAKKESYTLNLNKLDLTRFKTLEFSVKKESYQDYISLRVEFTNAFKERSEIYLRDIPSRWREYKINLSDFKNISDWSRLMSLSFIVEEWNTKRKEGVVYIDNVGLLK